MVLLPPSFVDTSSTNFVMYVAFKTSDPQLLNARVYTDRDKLSSTTSSSSPTPRVPRVTRATKNRVDARNSTLGTCKIFCPKNDDTGGLPTREQIESPICGGIY